MESLIIHLCSDCHDFPPAVCQIMLDSASHRCLGSSWVLQLGLLWAINLPTDLSICLVSTCHRCSTSIHSLRILEEVASTFVNTDYIRSVWDQWWLTEPTQIHSDACWKYLQHICTEEVLSCISRGQKRMGSVMDGEGRPSMQITALCNTAALKGISKRTTYSAMKEMGYRSGKP